MTAAIAQLAVASNTEVVRAKMRTLESLGLKEAIDGILITLGRQYHLIRLVTGCAERLEPKERRLLLAGGGALRYDIAILATGSQPAIPTIPGLDDVGYWTTHDVIRPRGCPPR